MLKIFLVFILYYEFNAFGFFFFFQFQRKCTDIKLLYYYCQKYIDNFFFKLNICKVKQLKKKVSHLPAFKKEKKRKKEAGYSCKIHECLVSGSSIECQKASAGSVKFE